MIEAVGLQQRARSLIGTYSRGMRQRLGIARALINDPAVVFLDEPTLGLDPQGQQELLKLVRWIARERNAGVILCSHQLADVESVCDDVVILNTGTVVAQGLVADVIGSADQQAVRLRSRRSSWPRPSRRCRGPAVSRAASAGGTSGWLRVEIAPPGEGSRNGQHVHNAILEGLIRAKVPVLGLQTGGARLQDVFLQVTQGAIE
jgi:ABC-2 type transport system ATP-binding protein